MKIKLEVTFEPLTCANCGVNFALAEKYVSERRKDGHGFYCPNGHSLYFGNGENERLRKQAEDLKRQKERLEARNVHLRDQRDAAERSARAQKGVATRVKNRVAAGVCPCCNRTVSQLANHMKTKHPEYVEEARTS